MKLLKVLLILTCAFAWSSYGDVVCSGTASSCAAASSTADPLTLVDITGTTSNCGGAAAAAANSVCLSANTVTAEGATADAFETLFAFGDATADQTLTCTGAASSLGCVVASPAVPVNGTTAGNALALVASPAIPNAGAGTDGAAAGGNWTAQAGAAARDTSGNADAGDYIFVESAGVGTGLSSTIQAPNGNTTTNPGVHGSDADTGVSFAAGELYLVANGTNPWKVVNSGLTAPSTGSISGAGGALTGLVKSVETVATTKTAQVGEVGEIYTNGSDTDGQIITLQDNPTVGSCYEFALTATNSSGAFVIAPSTGETLRQGAVTCGTVYSAVAIGSTSRICAVAGGSGGVWQVMYDAPAAAWTCTP